jgi:hypothetical protein
MTYRGSAALARQLTVRVKGSRGLDDDQPLLKTLEDSTGLKWHLESVRDEGHLSAGIVEIVLVAVLSRSTELAYGAVVEKVRTHVEQWRDKYLDKPTYEITEESVAEAADASSESPGPGT